MPGNEERLNNSVFGWNNHQGLRGWEESSTGGGTKETTETEETTETRGEGIIPIGGQLERTGEIGGKASDILAGVTREMWDDYKKRFYPLEEQLMGMTSYANPELMEESVAEGQGRASALYDAMWGAMQNKTRSYGQQWDAAQYQANKSAYDLDKTAALADAANRIREKIIERDREIATGASTAEKTYPGGYMGGT